MSIELHPWSLALALAPAAASAVTWFADAGRLQVNIQHKVLSKSRTSRLLNFQVHHHIRHAHVELGAVALLHMEVIVVNEL